MAQAPAVGMKRPELPQGPLSSFGGCFLARGINLASSSLAQGLHSASIPGILALDLCPSDTNKILTGKGACSACWGLRGVG